MVYTPGGYATFVGVHWIPFLRDLEIDKAE
jgi:hypothetical protein